MMIKRNLGVLAAAVVATSGAQAAFDADNAILIAYDAADDDTYFLDLGVTAQQLVDGVTVDLTSAGLATFLSTNAGAGWTVLGAVNDPTSVGGAPAIGQSLANSGLVSSSTSGNPVGTVSSDNEAQKTVWLDWLSDIQAAAGAATEFSVAGTDPVSMSAPRNSGFINDSLIGVDAASSLWYAQAASADGALLSDPTEVSQLGALNALVGSTGDVEINVSAVPVPAAAWLFGSALLGLGVVRRK
jgi:hypothetical protein